MKQDKTRILLSQKRCLMDKDIQNSDDISLNIGHISHDSKNSKAEINKNDGNQLKNLDKIRVLSLFSGIGAPEKALQNLGIDYELVGFSEIDKFASKSYVAVHGVDESLNLGDITKIDEQTLPKDIDLVTFGFPCQDISISGKQKGFHDENGNTTRSGLFFEALRIVEHCQPRIALAENVKNLTGKRFQKEFQIVLESLGKAGYNCYWKVINAKDFGIPQNRERVFIVCIRKDIDDCSFWFPDGFPLELRLKDMLDKEVDEKYYLSEKALRNIKFLDNKDSDRISVVATLNPEKKFQDRERVLDSQGLCCTLLARDYKDPVKIIQVAQMYPNSGNPQAGRIYDSDGIAPAMDTCSGGNRMPKIINNIKPRLIGGIGKQNFGKQYRQGNRIYSSETIAMALTSSPVGNNGGNSYLYEVTSAAMRGRSILDGKTEQHVEISDREYSNAITTVQKDSLVCERKTESIIKEIAAKSRKKEIGVTVKENGDIRTWQPDKGKCGVSELQINYDGNISNTVTATHMPKTYGASTGFRVRKLTPKECWRLMGFTDEDFEKAEKVNSNSQLYKQAGNSIVVQVLEAIFKQLQLINKL